MSHISSLSPGGLLVTHLVDVALLWPCLLRVITAAGSSSGSQVLWWLEDYLHVMSLLVKSLAHRVPLLVVIMVLFCLSCHHSHSLFALPCMYVLWGRHSFVSPGSGPPVSPLSFFP